MKTVLIAEDHADLREIFTSAFRQSNYEVHLAEDGIAAVEFIDKQLPDVLILDINMPRLTGLAVLRHVREIQGQKHVNVIIVTGNNMAEFSAEAELADLFLVKPVLPQQLFSLVDRLAMVY